MNDKLLKKYQGSLIGLAVGDALGVPAEFKMVGEFEPITDFCDDYRFSLPAGHWSDDTAMALCLANSLIEKNGFDPKDQIEKYKKWLDTGYCSSTGKSVGVGTVIQKALSLYKKGDVDPYIAISFPFSDGNGTLMKIAPIPLFFKDTPEDAMKYARLSSKVTHGSELAADACVYYTGLIIGALNNVNKEELLSELYSPIKNFWQSNHLSYEIENVARGSFKTKKSTSIQGSGYVVKSLEAALWAFYHSDSFEEGVLKAVNLGDDADTTGAIYGQLAGAYYGLEKIPEKWRRNVSMREEILEIAGKLFK